ncbi:MAG: hypothetical protein R6U17_04915 [Thermoplasmata archaeon]
MQHSSTKLILVLEAEESTDWDYLVDGVLTLRRDEVKGRRIRHIHLNKLRGVSIDRPVYLYTLKGGKFRYAPPFNSKLPFFEKSHEPIFDGEDTDHWNQRLFSTGTKALDEILDGGYPHDSLVIMEFAPDVPLAGQMNLIGSVLENFLAQERGVLFMPSSRDQNKFSRDGKIFGENTGNFFKIVDMGGVGTKDIKHALKETFKELKFNTNQPILTVCDWVSLEHSVERPRSGEGDRAKVAKDILEIMRENSSLTIGMVGPGFSFIENARYISDIYIKVFTLYNSLLMYGEKPNTEIYNITVREGKHPMVRYVKQV